MKTETKNVLDIVAVVMVVTGALVAAGVQYALKKWKKPNADWGYGSVRCAAGLWNLSQIEGER